MSEASGRREQAKAERRLRIVRAARDLIRETGKTDLSMRALSKRAEVSLQTPYNLFGSKRSVVLAVLEDERDFEERFARLNVPTSLDRIFGAHDLVFSYYTSDAGFYQTLWRALLNTNGQDDMGLATPERLERTRAIWLGLIKNAAKDGYLRANAPFELTLQTMGHITGGALLSWAMGSLPTDALTSSVGIGYALCLRGVATDEGAARLDLQLAAYQELLARLGTGVPERFSETL